MRYLRTVKEPIPEDQKGRYAMWKKYYNTAAGKGTEKAFMTSLEKYGLGE